MSKWFRQYYKSPKMMNEARQSQDEYEGRTKQAALCRAKRRPAHLPDPWDDRPRGYQRSWKKLRKTKYRSGHRGQKHILFIEDSYEAWKLKEHCEKYDIPFDMEEINEPYCTRQEPIKKAYQVGQTPIYLHRYRKIRGFDGQCTRVRVKELWFYVPLYEYVITGYRTKTYYRTKGYNCTWWSDKNIGVEYVLNRR